MLKLRHLDSTHLIDQSLDGDCGGIPRLIREPVSPVSESTGNTSDVVKVLHGYPNTFERSRVGEVLGIQS
jgi:hypothetical protein